MPWDEDTRSMCTSLLNKLPTRYGRRAFASRLMPSGPNESHGSFTREQTRRVLLVEPRVREHQKVPLPASVSAEMLMAPAMSLSLFIDQV
jgi:hypothetical protein